MTTEVVLDASAALAFLFGESGAAPVRACLPHARMSAVNLTEVVARLSLTGRDPARAHDLGCRIVDHDARLADLAGRLAPRTAPLGLSLGDRACLALALRDDLPVLTADRAWARLDLGLNIRLVR